MIDTAENARTKPKLPPKTDPPKTDPLADVAGNSDDPLLGIEPTIEHTNKKKAPAKPKPPKKPPPPKTHLHRTAPPAGTSPPAPKPKKAR